jgi:hypothetical protein
MSHLAPEDFDWITRPHEPGEPARHVAELSEPPERVDVPAGGLVRVAPGTALQTVNHGTEDLLVYAYGFPPEHEHAEVLD